MPQASSATASGPRRRAVQPTPARSVLPKGAPADDDALVIAELVDDGIEFDIEGAAVAAPERSTESTNLPSASEAFAAWLDVSPTPRSDAAVEHGELPAVIDRPSWVAEVPDRGYYDPELRSPEWIRRRGRPDNRADLRPDHRTSPRSELRADAHGTGRDGVAEWTDTVTRGRAFPTSYRASFLTGGRDASDFATGT